MKPDYIGNTEFPMPEEEINWQYVEGYRSASMLIKDFIKKLKPKLKKPLSEFFTENLEEEFDTVLEKARYFYKSYYNIAERNDKEEDEGVPPIGHMPFELYQALMDADEFNFVWGPDLGEEAPNDTG